MSPAPSTSTPEVFVTKIDRTGGTVVFSTIIGIGTPEAIAVDASGAIYVAGVDPGTNYPTTSGAYTAGGRCFLLKLNPSGSNLAYSSTLGCTYASSVTGMVVDTLGDAYVTGNTSTIPTTPHSYMPTTTGGGEFALKMNPQGSGLLYGTYLPVGPSAMTVDTQGNAYFTGGASVKYFKPTINAFPTEDPTQFSPTDDVFLLKLSADGSTLVFSTLFGGYGSDQGSSIALGPDGSIYIAGASRTSTGFGAVTAFPTTTGVLDTVPESPKGFLVRLPPTADSFIFSTLLTDLADGQCLNVNAADGSADVFAGQRLLRVSSDGLRLESSMLVASKPGYGCGQTAGRYAVSTSTQVTGLNVSPNLSPLGPGGNVDVWFTAFDANVPGAPELVLNTGELNVRSLPAANGTYPPAVQTFSAETVGVSVPIGATGTPPPTDTPSLTASPESPATPTNITATVSEIATLNDAVIVFAPGVQNALAVLPTILTHAPMTTVFSPPSLAFNIVNSGAAPVSSSIAVSTSVVTDVFGSQQSTSAPFSISVGGFTPSWLKISPTSGTTPANVVVTVNPAGLSNGPYGAEIVINGAPYFVSLQVGPPPATPPQLAPTFGPINLQLTPTITTASGSFHLDSTGAPISFKIDPPPSWLTLSEQTGITPADITVTATSPGNTAGTFDTQLNISRMTDGSSIGLLSVGVNQTVPGYEGFFYLFPLPPINTNQFMAIPQIYAPGALFFISINAPLPIPQMIVNANPGSLASSLAGYTFMVGNLIVPLRSYTNGVFQAQLPYELAPGNYTINAFDSTGTMIGSVMLNYVGVAVPGIFVPSLSTPLRATKQDGSTIDAGNPVNVGDQILVRLSGQGSTVPPIPTGKAADPNNPSIPALPVTATIGGKPAQVVSAQMSAIDAGVLDVWIQVPDLYAGDQNVRVRIASQTAGPLPIKVAGTSSAPAPDLVASIGFVGAISQGQNGANFSIYVSNSGSVPTTATAAMQVQFPAGMTLTGLSGTGWTCVVQTATCARADVLAAQETYPPITATVNVDPNAALTLTVSAVVSGGGETLTWNDTATDVVQVNNVCPFQFSSGGQAFTATGGTAVLTIATRSSCMWGGASAAPWVTLSPPSFGYGNGTLTYAVAPNTGAARSTSIYLSGNGQYFKIDQAAATIPGLQTIGSLAQIASEGTWDFNLDAVNLGSVSAATRFTFTDNNGNPLALPLTFPQSTPGPGPELAATLDRTLAPNAQIIMDSTGPASAAALVGSGQISASGEVSAFGIFSNPTYSWNALVPLETRNASKYYLPFDNTTVPTTTVGGAATQLWTGVAVANLNASPANIQAVIRNDSGRVIGTTAVPVNAMGHTSFMLSSPPPGFPVLTNLRGTIEFDTPSGGQITVLGLRAFGTSSLTTLPVLSNTDTPGGSIAHVAYNAGFTSTFYLVNTSAKSANFTLRFFDPSGNPLSVPLTLPQTETNATTAALSQPLAAGATLVVQTQAIDSAASVVGSAQLTANGSIGGFEIFRWTTYNQEATVPLETRNPHSFILVFDDTNGLTTGVALANLADSTASIGVNIFDDTGASLGAQTPITLPAYGHSSFMLPDSARYPVTGNKRGFVEFVVPAGGAISAIGLRATNSGTLTTIPVLKR